MKLKVWIPLIILILAFVAALIFISNMPKKAATSGNMQNLNNIQEVQTVQNNNVVQNTTGTKKEENDTKTQTTSKNVVNNTETINTTNNSTYMPGSTDDKQKAIELVKKEVRR